MKPIKNLDKKKRERALADSRREYVDERRERRAEQKGFKDGGLIKKGKPKIATKGWR
jgi:hypothetical protein